MKSLNFKYVTTFLVLSCVFALAYRFSTESMGTPKPSPVAWKSLDKGMTLAHQSNKKVLVDVYTDWCSWCKKMDSDVYTDKRIVRLLDEHFVAVKLNAESGNLVSFRGTTYSEAEFARQLGVTGYPTTLFFDQNSNPITDLSGYAVPDRFAKVLDFIGKDYYKTVSFQEYLNRQPSLP